MIRIIRKKYYYYAEGDDAFALFALTGIHPNRGKMWSVSAEYIDLIIGVLKRYDLSYCLESDGEMVLSKSGNNCKYDILVELGKTAFGIQCTLKKENNRIKQKLKYINQL